jgi:hypothetical protein
MTFVRWSPHKKTRINIPVEIIGKKDCIGAKKGASPAIFSRPFFVRFLGVFEGCFADMPANVHGRNTRGDTKQSLKSRAKMPQAHDLTPSLCTQQVVTSRHRFDRLSAYTTGLGRCLARYAHT